MLRVDLDEVEACVLGRGEESAGEEPSGERGDDGFQDVTAGWHVGSSGCGPGRTKQLRCGFCVVKFLPVIALELIA